MNASLHELLLGMSRVGFPRWRGREPDRYQLCHWPPDPRNADQEASGVKLFSLLRQEGHLNPGWSS